MKKYPYKYKHRYNTTRINCQTTDVAVQLLQICRQQFPDLIQGVTLFGGYRYIQIQGQDARQRAYLVTKVLRTKMLEQCLEAPC